MLWLSFFSSGPYGSRIKVSDELLCLIITSHPRVQPERLWSQADMEILAVGNDRGDSRSSRTYTQEAMMSTHARVLEGYSSWWDAKGQVSLPDWDARLQGMLGHAVARLS